MKTIQIDLSKLAHVENPRVSDGLGGEYGHGEIVDLPEDVAALMVAKGFGSEVAGKIKAVAVAEAKERAAEIEQAAQQSRAISDMDMWDSLPPEIRREAQEHGQEVIERYLAGLPSMELDAYEAHPGEPFVEARGGSIAHEQAALDEAVQPRRRRGRPPKVAVPEGGEAE